MASEFKGIEDQLKKLNQNIERFLRMIDPTLHPNPLQKVKGIVELDPTKKYLIVFKEDVPIQHAYDMAQDIKTFLPEIESYFLSGSVLEEIEVKK